MPKRILFALAAILLVFRIVAIGCAVEEAAPPAAGEDEAPAEKQEDAPAAQEEEPIY